MTLLALLACGDPSTEDGIKAPPLVVQVVRSSGVCGKDPIILEYAEKPGRIEA
ncbi:MAG: hypothetical protein ABIS21_08720 [Acidimicrobiales bacterium]